jgi:hypothetical protein
MRKVKIKCVECGKQVVVSSIQPCFYCGRQYPDPEIDHLLKDAKAEILEMEKFLDEKLPLAPEGAPPGDTTPLRKVIYFVAVLFFLAFCLVCVLLGVRLLR